jgi:hypothetical protein
MDFVPTTFRSTRLELNSTPLLLVVNECTPSLLDGTLQIAVLELITAPDVTIPSSDPKTHAKEDESTKCSPRTVTSDLPVSVTTVGVTENTRERSLNWKMAPGSA